MTSFILMGETDSEKMVNTKSENWKCLQNKASRVNLVNWSYDRSTIDFGLYIANPTDSIDGNRYPLGWGKPEYNDSKWTNAAWCDVTGSREKDGAGGIIYSGRKLLIPRRTALLGETNMPFAIIRRSSGIALNENFIHGKGSLMLPANSKVRQLINQVITPSGMQANFC